MYSKICKWLLVKWKAVVAFLGLTATALLFYMRSKDQKKVLDNAILNHKKELETNKAAEKKLVKGIEDISAAQDEKIKKSSEKNKKKSEELSKKKEVFIDEAASDPDLAKNIAEKIGATFVDTEN